MNPTTKKQYTTPILTNQGSVDDRTLGSQIGSQYDNGSVDSTLSCKKNSD